MKFKMENGEWRMVDSKKGPKRGKPTDVLFCEHFHIKQNNLLVEGQTNYSVGSLSGGGILSHVNGCTEHNLSPGCDLITEG